jgi:predicted RNA-binding Zn ribbon-like protein
MLFAHDTRAVLALAADLVNIEELPGPDALDVWLEKHEVFPRPPATDDDVAAILALRPRLRAVWQAASASGTAQLAGLINELFTEAAACPWLVDHGGGFGWHLHVSDPDARLEHRLAAQAAFAFADLVRLRETERLRQCEAPGCEAVFADLSKNRSRRYCDTGNCGNLQHVRAYRARRASS